jgi:CRP-like cAMP-binding protein
MARVAAFLERRAAMADGDSFTLGMTQEELAEELGTVREVIVRSLAGLRHEGAIASVGRGHFRVLDSAALRRLAED